MRRKSRHARFSPWVRFEAASNLAHAAPEPAPSWRGLAVVYGLVATVPAVLFAATNPPWLAALLGGLLVAGVAFRHRARLRGTSAGRLSSMPATHDAVRRVEQTLPGRADDRSNWSGSD